MFRIVLRALRRRRAHAVTLVLLGLVAAAGAAAAPGYAVAGAQRLAVAELAAADPAEQLVSVSGDVASGSDLTAGLDRFDQTDREHVDLPGFTRIHDVRVDGSTNTARLTLAWREGACDHLVVVGACPSAPGEVIMTADAARTAGLPVGDAFALHLVASERPLSLRLVGTYEPTDPADPYWGPTGSTRAGERLAEGTMFTALATLVAGRPDEVTVTVDHLVTPAAVQGRDPQVLTRAYLRAGAELRGEGYTVTSRFVAYANRVTVQSNVIYLGVVAATLQVLILAWFALGLAIRETGDVRRPDVGLLKLRGARRGAMWTLAAGQAVLPIVAGGVVGLVLGGLGSRVVIGPVVGAEAARLDVLATIGAAAVAVVVAILAALGAERRLLAESVVDLSRRVPSRRRGWRGGLVDLTVVALALAAAFELRTSTVASSSVRGLDVLAPTLIALAVGVVAARVVPWLAAALATRALPGGRLVVGLSAVQLARRPGLTSVLTMLTLAVAVLTGTASGWAVSRQAEHDRAQLETGADRVLTVQAASPTALLAAVQAADPSGRYAMAVARTTTGTPVLAVDSTRLAAVVPALAAYGLPAWSEVARELRGAAPDPTYVHNGVLSLDARWQPAPVAVPVAPPPGTTGPVLDRITALVQVPDGRVLPVPFDRLAAATTTYRATVEGCAPQCRLAGFALSGPHVAAGAQLTLRRLAGAGADVVDRSAFGDRERWRTSVTDGDALPTIATSTTGLALTVDAPPTSAQGAVAVYLRDAATPVPVILAGTDTAVSSPGRPTVAALGAGPVPSVVVGRAALLPRVQTPGALVDLGTVARIRPGTGVLEVWLTADAPPAVVTALTGHGVSIVDDDSVAARVSALEQQAPAVALRYLLLVAVIGVALAVGAFVVAASVERAPRAAELAALRRQGLRPRTLRAVGYGGYLTFVGFATVLGVVTALVTTRTLAIEPRLFSDDWTVLPSPAPDPVMLAVVAAGTVVVAGLAAALSAAALGRAARLGGARLGDARRGGAA